MSGHLHDDTSLYYITFFVERYISKTSSLLSTIQVIRHVNNTIIAFHGYYYTRRITTNIFNSRMRLVRQRLHGFINPRPPLKASFTASSNLWAIHHIQNIHGNSFSTNPFKPAPAMLAAAPSVPIPTSLVHCSPLIAGKPSF